MKTFPKPLTAREERECLERLKDGDQEARTALIERNMRLVAHVAKKYQNTDYDMEDLLSVGDEIYVKFMEIDDKGRYNLSRKDAMNDLAKKGRI